jgi:hypothetical protein
MSINDLINLLQTNVDLKQPLLSKGIYLHYTYKGISFAKHESTLAEIGLNVTKPPKKRSSYLKFLEALSNLFNVFLFAGGALYLLLYAIEPEKNFESVSIFNTRFG